MKKTKWIFDPAHTEIGFKVKHLMITNVKGHFKTYDANILTTGDDFRTAEIDFRLDAATVDTGNEQRDTHLKSPDFFDVVKFKEIRFKAESFTSSLDNEGEYELWGDLAIKDVTKRIKLDVEFGGVATDPWGNTKAGFTVYGKISRKEFGLLWNVVTEAGGMMVSDEVRISCEVQLIKQQ